jgi:hypothetical protein
VWVEAGANQTAYKGETDLITNDQWAKICEYWELWKPAPCHLDMSLWDNCPLHFRKGPHDIPPPPRDWEHVGLLWEKMKIDVICSPRAGKWIADACADAGNPKDAICLAALAAIPQENQS